MITELVFDHALRVRVKAETQSDDPGSSGRVEENADSGTRKNLVGRINNLVSSDLASLDWVCAHAVSLRTSSFVYARRWP